MSLVKISNGQLVAELVLGLAEAAVATIAVLGWLQFLMPETISIFDAASDDPADKQAAAAPWALWGTIVTASLGVIIGLVVSFGRGLVRGLRRRSR